MQILKNARQLFSPVGGDAYCSQQAIRLDLRPQVDALLTAGFQSQVSVLRIP